MIKQSGCELILFLLVNWIWTCFMLLMILLQNLLKCLTYKYWVSCRFLALSSNWHGRSAAKMQCLIGRHMLACVLFTWCFYDGHHWILTGAIGDVLAIAICLIGSAIYILASRSSAQLYNPTVYNCWTCAIGHHWIFFPAILVSAVISRCFGTKTGAA